MNTPEDAHGGDGQAPAERMRARLEALRARWAQIPRRKRIAMIAVATLVLVLLLRRRGAPLVQLNLNLTFRPVAATAVSLLGPATVGELELDDDD